MKALKLLLALEIMFLSACFSQVKEQKDFDFWKYTSEPFANKKGIITAGVSMCTYYGKPTNPYGHALICLIHKNGGEWWCEQARKNFPNNVVPEWAFAEQIFKKSTSLLKDYHKWAFVIDKKYLKPEVIRVDGDFDPNDPTGEKGKNTIMYEVPEGKSYEAILYEQKAGSNTWVAIEKRMLLAGEGQKDIKDWQEEVMRKKIQEYP